MHGIGLGSLHSSQAYRSREMSHSAATSVASKNEVPGRACRPSQGDAETQRQVLYQSVVLVLRERFAVSSQSVAPVAGVSQAEQSDNQLAAAVGAALNASPDVPAEQVGAVAEAGLDEALEAVGTAPEGSGGLEDIAAEIRRRVHSLVAAFVAGRESGAGEVMIAAKVTTKERGVLEIRTLEGDIVKIDFRSSMNVRLGTAEGSGGQESLKVRVSERTSLQVEGDLNSAELAAIGDLVRKVDSLANEFFAGDVEQAFAAAADLQIDSTQLADYSLRLSMSQKVRIRTTESLASLEGVPQPVADTPSVSGSGTPSAIPSVAEPVKPAGESTAVSTEIPELTAETSGTAVAESATSVPTATGTAAGDAPELASVEEIIGAFVARLRSSFTMSSTDQGLGLTASIKLTLLTAAIETHPESTSVTPAATASLQKAVEQASA